MKPKCASRMDSPEWLEKGRGEGWWGGRRVQSRPQHTKMETGRDANVHGVHHTNVQDQAGTARERERERNKERKEGGNKGGENR